MEAPDARRPKRARRDSRFALDAAVRVADRARQRNMFTGHDLEDHVLRSQLEAMAADGTIETTDEYELVTRRFNAISLYTAEKQLLDLQSKTYQYQLAVQSLKVAAPTDRTAPSKAFDCVICLDERPLSTVRLAMPCGHAFCAACIAAHQEANRTRDPRCDEKGCPVCRGPITSVFKPSF